MGHKERGGRERGDRGSAAVELALIVTPLLLLLTGFINFGVLFSQQLALDNSARQAARAVVVGGNTSTQVKADEQAELSGTAVGDGSAVVFAFSRSGDDPCKGSALGDSVRVTTTYNAKFLIPWILPGVPGSVNLQGSGEFQCEYS